jgi:hypothetical protein
MAKAPYINEFIFLRNGASRDANVKGDVTPVEFSYTVPAGDTLLVNRLIAYYQDTGNFQDLMDGFDIKTNAEWAGRCYDWQYISTGVGDNVAAVRWTFGRTGRPIPLLEGEKIVVTINDDMTFLTGATFQIQGVSS